MIRPAPEPPTPRHHERQAMKTFSIAIAALLLATLAGGPLAAQVSVTVKEERSSAGGAQALTFESFGMGEDVTRVVSLTVDPRSAEHVSLSSIVISGSPEFAVTLEERLPVSLYGEYTYDITLSYRPSTPGPANAVMLIGVTRVTSGEADSEVSSVELIGKAPFYALSYMLPSGRSQDVPTGAGVDFGRAPTGKETEATVVVRNIGSASGTVRSVALSGMGFSLSNPPSFPIRLEPGRGQGIQIAFNPVGTSRYSGSMMFAWGGPGRSVSLLGTGGDLLQYRLTTMRGGESGTPSMVQSATTLGFGASATSYVLVGRNTHSNSHLIGGVQVMGPFMATVSPTLPAALDPDGELRIEVEPAPNASVGDTGKLVIGDAVFPLELALPANPRVAFVHQGSTVGPSQEVSLGFGVLSAFPLDITGTLTLAFESDTFQGNSGAVFSTGRPSATFTIPAGSTRAMFGDGSQTVEIATGLGAGSIVVTAQMRTDPWGIDLTPDDGSQEERFLVQVEDLPAVQFSRDGGTVDAADQVGIGVSIASPYPTDIGGILTLRFETRHFASDPTIQWSTGGRQALFVIPAGGTQAVFTGGSTEAAFQTGTVAGLIHTTAQLYRVPSVIEAASVEQLLRVATDVTPDVVPALQFSVMEGAPVLRSVTLGQTNQGVFALNITGYATNRSVNSLSFRLVGGAETLLRTPDLEADISEEFQSYFGSAQSGSTGGQFTATVAMVIDEGAFEDIVSVAVTATNELGSSNTITLTLN